jgi:endonuclease/exonuclease/phosphatase family metal-dependent hydrolase
MIAAGRAPGSEDARPDVLRIATYNIRALRDDAAAVRRVLSALRADVVCIQEAPRFLGWRRRCHRLAADVDLTMIAGGRRAAANLILASPDVVVHRHHELNFSKDRRLSLRGAALAEMTVRGHRVTVVGTHLDGVDEPRMRHIGELRQAIERFAPRGALVIGVDVNAEPGSPSWSQLTLGAVDAAAVASVGDPMTNQPRTPTRRIDALFVGPGLRVLSTRAVDSQDVNRASDHRPVVAELVPA